MRFAGPAPGYASFVPLGTSIFLIAVGAILRYAVTATVSGIDITTVGLILMIVGAIGLLLSLFWDRCLEPGSPGIASERLIERDPDEPPAGC